MNLKLRKVILMGIGGLILLLLLVSLISKRQKLVIITDKKDYEAGEGLRVKIENYFLKKACFSSCHPYYLELKELKDKEWASYNYKECLHSNIAETCIEPGQIKAFEISLSGIKKGLHRISLPACINCLEGTEFRKDKIFYSNEFEIK